MHGLIDFVTPNRVVSGYFRCVLFIDNEPLVKSDDYYDRNILGNLLVFNTKN